MYILGISCFYHDSSAVLLKDGMIVAGAEEERFSRKKHDNGFPEKAIDFCLLSQGILIEDIDYVAFYEKPLLKFERILSQHIEVFPRSFKTFISSMPSWVNEKVRVQGIIQKKLKFKGDIFFIEHHLSHASSAFLPSPFEKAAILTVDGVGEWSTTTLGRGIGSKVELMKEIRFPHSLGLLYSTITAYLGFSVNNSEYKIMGLSAYGNMDRNSNEYYRKILNVVNIKEDGSYEMDMSYFKYHYADKMPSKKLCNLLGGPVFKRNSEVTKTHKDIAAAIQMVTEDIMTKMLHYLYLITGLENVVLAGGVALNSVYNGKIISKTPFKNIWIQPNASDGGTSMGAALFAYNSILENERVYVLKNAYLGPQFSDKEIENFLKENKIKYSEFSSDSEIVKKVARLIFENNVIGWFQKGMEWGPRALGARSVLSNPANIKMKEILNLKVKHREKFRPFAPVVCADDADKYFDCDKPIPDSADFMLMVYPIKEEFRDKIPAVTHVDGSGRLQTVKRNQNPLYYDLIKEFGSISKMPILINTSFNVRGEPIVCTIEDAYRCMMGTEIDYLVAGKFIIKRADNARDIWNSELTAND
ncbi:MAG: hypothetical protein ACD_11C00018G0034 [uncultured bacterium]|nr:MAG: hypothetical protein ACD_11C00018G0034 [uncultured bacterium]HBR71560.1 hypothetical protein [Candidatus Moranbacteria bacterium]